MIESARSTSWAAVVQVAAMGLWFAGGDATAQIRDSWNDIGSDAVASERIMEQGEWAASLVDVLGLTPALSDEASPADVFGLLCPTGVERGATSGGDGGSRGGVFQTALDVPRNRDPGDPIRMTVSLPVPAVYMLSVEGVGKQRWLIDKHVVGHLDPTELGVAQANTVVPLRRGPHEITAYLTNDARADRVEIAAYRSLCIAPANGWRADRPLTHGDRARTIVRALGIEQRLPKVGDPIVIEGEAYDQASAWGTRTHRKLSVPASAHTWAMAAGSPAEFSYRVRIDDPSVFTVEGLLHGAEAQIWSIDGSYRVTVEPGEGADGFVRTDVITVPLTAGEHVIRALIPRDAGIDSIRLVRRKSLARNYLDLIEEAGFRGGAPAAYVTRSDAYRSLSNPTFSEHAQHFLSQLANGEAPILLVENDLDRLYSRPLSPLLPPEL
jgi:hypothetical protein